MTCIVGVAHNGKVFMGGDSAGVCPETGALQLRKDPKVFKNGEYLIGVSGSWRASQALRYALMEHSLPKNGDAFKHMLRVFLPSVQYVTRGIEDRFELLVGFRGRLFHLYGTEQVSEEILNYEACGSGAQVARGSLYANSFEAPEDPRSKPLFRIQRALNAAERFCSGVRGPFTILEM